MVSDFDLRYDAIVEHLLTHRIFVSARSSAEGHPQVLIIAPRAATDESDVLVRSARVRDRRQQPTPDRAQ